MINNELLNQFAAKGLTINEGIVINARLVQSASHPISKEKMEEEKQKRETHQGKLDKNGNLLNSPVILNRTGRSKMTSLT